jgi:hypothetical protein
MKLNRFFTLSHAEEPKRVKLFCELRSVESGVIKGCVVNGAWSFTLSEGVLQVDGKSEEHRFPVVISWTGDLPSGLGDYNDVIEYIERRINHWRITNWMIDRRLAFLREVARCKRAIGAAKRAYLKVYEANSRFVEDEDDLIPF